MNRDRNYEICWLQICPFIIELKYGDKKIYKPDRDNYEYRLCVLDKSKKEAVDVLFKIKYDHIETSSIYFLGNESNRIKEDKRYACLKLPLSLKTVADEDLNAAMQIISNIKKGTNYSDGNAISNLEYLKLIDDNKPKAKVKKI